MTADLAGLRSFQGDEHAELVQLLRDLPPEQWATPSLCEGWSVRDVVEHLIAWNELLVADTAAGRATRFVSFAARIISARLSTRRLNAHLPAGLGDLGLEEVLARFDRPGVGSAPRLFDKLAPGVELAEYMVHQQDIRRGLGAHRTIPAHRLVAALDAVGGIPGAGVRRRIRGLALRATDVDWGSGSGPEVSGPGEALLLAMAGRSDALADLEGDGLPELVARHRGRSRRADRRRNVADWIRPLRRLTRALEVAQVRHLGGSGLSVIFRTPVLVLETTGRRTGRRRRTPLAYHRLHDGELIVVGGAGGQARQPDWVANVRADAAVRVTVDRRTHMMRAVAVEGAERDELWPNLVAVWPRLEAYERRARRPVPVFRLVPA